MKTRNLILAALFAALTAVGAFIRIPVGPVPITVQTLFTILSGIILGAKLGALSQALYIIIGLLGLPVFAGGGAGLSYVANPGFGYLLGFIAGAYTVGKISELLGATSFVKLFYASLAGVLVVYIIGVPYLYIILVKVMGTNMSLPGVIKAGFIIFLPGDLAKCAVAAAAGQKIIPALKKAGLIKDSFK